MILLSVFFLFFFNATATTEIYTLSLHDALPIYRASGWAWRRNSPGAARCSPSADAIRSEEHTSELQSRFDLVCRLLLEKKKKIHIQGKDNIGHFIKVIQSGSNLAIYNNLHTHFT